MFIYTVVQLNVSKKRLQSVKQKENLRDNIMNDRKLIGEWKGKLTINGTLKERKIQIFKVKNQKNKIVNYGS